MSRNHSFATVGMAILTLSLGTCLVALADPPPAKLPPLPPPDKSIPQPDQPAAQPPNPQGAQSSPSQSQSQTFTGKIVKDGDKYVLKGAGNTSYQLDDQSSVKQYEDKDVKIVGTLNAGSNTIRVVKIELMS